MPDNQELLKERLGKLGLAPRREAEILREIGEHLEDHVVALVARGVPREEALQQALAAVPDWPEFRNEILRAETEEATVNSRTKALWLPALCALLLSNGLLELFQIFGRPPRFYVFHSGKDLELFCAFIIPWLITQPVTGAVAAYWSRRAGGDVRHQLLAALAPAIALLGVFVLILPFAWVFDKNVGHHTQLVGFLVLTVTWVLLPSIPLLVGAAPFLRKPQPQA